MKYLKIEYFTKYLLFNYSYCFFTTECKCKNGKCIEEKNKVLCTCNPEFGLYKEDECKGIYNFNLIRK